MTLSPSEDTNHIDALSTPCEAAASGPPPFSSRTSSFNTSLPEMNNLQVSEDSKVNDFKISRNNDPDGGGEVRNTYLLKDKSFRSAK